MQELLVSLRGTRGLMPKHPAKLIVGCVGVGAGAGRKFIDALAWLVGVVVKITRPEDGSQSTPADFTFRPKDFPHESQRGEECRVLPA